MEFVAFLGNDNENWGQITGLINKGKWEKIILVKSKESEDYLPGKKSEIIKIDTSKSLVEIKEELIKKLKGKLSGLDVNLSLASGNGKEHMALISSLLSLPVGIRLVVFTRKGIETIN